MSFKSGQTIKFEIILTPAKRTNTFLIGQYKKSDKR